MFTNIQRMSPNDFRRLSQLITQELGIQMTDVKQPLLEGRLNKRLNALGLPSFNSYCDLLFSVEGAREKLIFLDLVTTNKTDFFRENYQFVYIDNQILHARADEWQGKNLKAWSAGCSSGEEPYTLAMVLEEFKEAAPFFSYSIYATDICQTVLQTAVTAVYPEERALPIPIHLKQKYLLRSKNKTDKTIRMAPELRRNISFDRLNLVNDSFDHLSMFDLVFCRNVIIYFGAEVRQRVLTKLCQRLRPGGYLFLGHSETLTNIHLPLEQVGHSIYLKH